MKIKIIVTGVGVTCLLIGVTVIGKELPTTGIYLVPQSHIDVAWFWRYDPETIEVVIPWTFGQAADNLEQFADYYFSAGQAPLFEGLRGYHPLLAKRVDKFIRSGRFEIVGGHWLEFEGTGPCGESIVRQCIYGKQYFQQAYGVELRNAWQVDAWSHPWTLPQILKKCEIDYYIFHRCSRGEHTFWWESADGSRVLAYKPFHGGNDLEKAIAHHRKMQAQYNVDVSMWRIGRGDHGGGLGKDEIEKLKKQMAVSPVPARFSRLDTFLAVLEKQKINWPVLRDELGFELEGCHSNAGPIKAANRRCENRLIEAEKFSAIASRVAGIDYPKDKLKSAWLDVLMNQFHDTISGCVIPAAYQDALDLYSRALSVAEQYLGGALAEICERIDTRGEGIPVVVFNSLSWPRTGPVEVNLAFREKPDGVMFTTHEDDGCVGQIVRTQKRGDMWQAHCVFIARDVPSIGYKTYWAKVRGRSLEGKTNSMLHVENWKLESDNFLVQIDSNTGNLIRIFDKQHNVDLIPKGAQANEIQIIEETGDSEGRLRWGDKNWPPDPLSPWNGWKVIEKGPVRTTVRIRNTWNRHNRDILAAADRFICLYANMSWIEFRTHFEWNSTGKMVKLAFPTLYRQTKPTYDIPYGTIVREANGKERPALRWVDLGNEDSGVALLNDCRYGHDVYEGVIRLNAIRSPVWPATNPDCGHQEVTYALYPHSGDWRQGRVMQHGYEFNNPLIAVISHPHKGILSTKDSFLRIDRANVILSVTKQGEEGTGLIVRAYEIAGENCTAQLKLNRLAAKGATLVNLLERKRSKLSIDAVSQEEINIIVPLRAHEIVTIYFE